MDFQEKVAKVVTICQYSTPNRVTNIFYENITFFVLYAIFSATSIYYFTFAIDCSIYFIFPEPGCLGFYSFFFFLTTKQKENSLFSKYSQTRNQLEHFYIKSMTM